MAEQTKEELLRLLQEKEAQIAELQGSVQRLSAAGEGWLITTQNPLYDGQVFGVQFVNGQAYIRKEQKVPYFERAPVKDATYAKLGMTAEQIAAAREREKISSAELAVQKLQSDFGYHVEYFGAERLMDLQGRIDDRLRQRVQAEEIQQQEALAMKTMQPGWVR